MKIKSELNEILKKAIKENNVLVKNVVRLIKNKVTDYCLARGIDRNIDDDMVWKTAILAYQKSISKGLELLKIRNVGGGELAKEYEFEIEFCNKFLPKKKTEKEIRELVLDNIKELGNLPVGKLIGEIMKNVEVGTVDSKLLKKVVIELVG